jgi:hypothetical protein
MIGNMQKWFFSDPRELHQFYFTNAGTYATAQRNETRPIMILTALEIPQLPPDMVTRLSDLFSSIHKPEADNDGFNYLKYPDNDLVAYGLIERGNPQSRAFVEAVLRDCIRSGEFAETLEGSGGKGLRATGVRPSLFSAMNIIEFTWLLNDRRYDSGRTVQCRLPANLSSK